MPQVAPSVPPPRRWWRWLVPRFSLRTILLLMTVVCLILGSGVMRAERQRLACEELTRNGWQWWFEGFSENDFHDGRILENEPWWMDRFSPSWRKSHGVHYWRSVTSVRDNRDKAPEMFAVIAQLPALRELVIAHGEDPDDRALWPIVGNFRTLRKLTLRRSTIDDMGMMHVGRLTGLKHLDLGGTIVGDEGIKHLARLTSLENVKLDDTNVTDDALAHLAALPKLNYVDLSNTRVTSEGVVALSRRRPSIDVATDSSLKNDASWLGEYVVYERDRPFDTGADLLSSLPAGSFAHFVFVDGTNPITPERLRELSKTRYVKTLKLSGSEIGDSETTHFLTWKVLLKAYFDRTSLRHEGFKWLGDMGTLRELIVVGSPVTQQDIAELAKLDALHTLTLCDVRLDSSTLGAILALPALSELELKNCPLPADAAEQFSQRPRRLNHLSLAGTGLSPEVFLQHVHRTCNLLTWEGVYVDRSVMAWLTQQSPQPNSLVMEGYDSNSRRQRTGRHASPVWQRGDRERLLGKLTLRSRFVRDSHALQALADWPDPWHVDFRGADVGTATLEALASYRFIESLALTQTNISDSDLNLATNWTFLRNLDLGGCAITDAGVALLEPCWRLQKLRLDRTSVGDNSIKTIVELKQLKFLSLRETRVTDAGLLQLEGLENLETLRLGGTPVTAEAIERFRQRFPRCNVDLTGPEVYDVPVFWDN